MIDEKLDISFVYTEFQYLESFEDIAVAVSGGADSMALLLLLRDWYLNLLSIDEEAPEIHVLTVDHALRPEAAEETVWVKEQASKLGLNCTILQWEGEKPDTGIQEEARKARYNLMADWCRKNNVPAILTAHHMDDQSETVLMRLARGAGVTGLAGVSRHTRWDGVNIIRPLLNVSGRALRKYLTEKQQVWIEDPSNGSDDYERVRIRKVMPHLEQFGIESSKLARSAARMRRAENALESWTENTLRQCLNCMPEGLATINWKLFQEVPEEIQLRILSKTLQIVGGKEQLPSLSGLEERYAQLIGKSNCTTTMAGCIIQREKSRIIVSREVRGSDPHTVRLDPGQSIVWDNRFVVSLSGQAPEGLSIGFLTEKGYLGLLNDNLDTNELPEILLHKSVRNSLPALYKDVKPVHVPFLQYSYDHIPEDLLKIELKNFF